MRPVLGLVVLLVAGCSAGTAAPAPTAAPTTVAPTTAAPTTTAAAAAPRVTRSAVPRPTSTGRPAYPWSERRVTSADLTHSWHPGCPVGPAGLRMLTLRYVGFDGARHTGQLVVAIRAVPSVVQVFRTLDARGFPVRSLRPIDDFGGSDDASMAADNTSGFNCRDAVGGSGWSMHAYGLAIDVDPRENPYVLNGKVMPPQGAPYTDRSRVRPGMAVPGGVLVRAFADVGWAWGGAWSSTPDYQHFSANGR